MNKKASYLLLLLFPLSVFAQQEPLAIIKLDWEFFKNDKPKNAEDDAVLGYHLKYKSRIIKVEGERVFFQFEVTAELDTAKSYFDFNKKYNDKRLLDHEQGHADILVIYARKLKKTFDEGVFHKTDYKPKIKEIFGLVYSQMKCENEKYDLESNHGRSRVIQNKWNLYFKKELENSLY